MNGRQVLEELFTRDDLFEQKAGKLLALIRLRLGHDLRRRLESRDILQGTLIKALENAEQMRAESSTSVMGWLVRIAENEILDQVAHHGRQQRNAAREVPLAPKMNDVWAARIRSATSRLVWREQFERLEKALESLDKDHREVVVLRRFEELSYPEIGRRLDRNPDACRMLFARAMTALTVALQSSPNAVQQKR